MNREQIKAEADEVKERTDAWVKETGAKHNYTEKQVYVGVAIAVLALIGIAYLVFQGVILIDKKTIIIVACVLITGFVACWYLFGSGTRNSNNVDARLSDLEKRLSDTEAEQRKTTAAIESAQRTTGTIREIAESIKSGLAESQATVDRGRAESESARESIGNARTTVSECEAVLNDSREKLTECQSIFERVEQSNQKRTSSSEAAGNSP